MIPRILHRWRRQAECALQTGSFRTARSLYAQRPGLAEIRLPGFAGTFRFRTGTSDAKLMQVLAEQRLPPEYVLPDDLSPRVIMDIGANIGTVTALLAQRFPAARIFAYEPLPENFRLLRHNVSQFDNVVAMPYGLGSKTQRITYQRSDNPLNFAGGGFQGGQVVPDNASAALQVFSVADALQQQDIDHVDFIKVDTEGAEHDILTSFPEKILSSVQFIAGELHGTPKEEALLAFLRERFAVHHFGQHGPLSWFHAQHQKKPAPTPDIYHMIADAQSPNAAARASHAEPADDPHGVQT